MEEEKKDGKAGGGQIRNNNMASVYDIVKGINQAAAKVLNEKRFSDVECDVRVEYELKLQKENYELRLDYKDIEINAWKDKYESMMILKAAENDRLMELVTKQKPGSEPFMVVLGFGIGTLTSLGIFALSTEIAKQ